MLNIPNIQQAMSVFVAEELSEVLNTKVVIGRINMGLLNRIIIDDVLLDDQSGQEMLKVTRLSAKFDIMPFLKERYPLAVFSSSDLISISGKRLRSLLLILNLFWMLLLPKIP